MWLPALFVLKTRCQAPHRRATCDRSPSLNAHGRTLPWISSQDCRPQQVISPYSQSLTASPRRRILWPCPNFPLPWRRLSCSHNMCSGYMAFLKMLSLIGVPSSPPRCGRSFVLNLGHKSAYPLAFTFRQMAKQRGQASNWKPCCAALSPLTSPPGVSS